MPASDFCKAAQYVVRTDTGRLYRNHQLKFFWNEEPLCKAKVMPSARKRIGEVLSFTMEDSLIVLTAKGSLSDITCLK